MDARVVDLTLSGCLVEYMIECKCLILAEPDLWFAWGYIGAYSAHIQHFFRDLWPYPVGQSSPPDNFVENKQENIINHESDQTSLRLRSMVRVGERMFGN